MQDSFNPYHQWLEIPPAEQPPDYYRLLGLKRFEDDPATIDSGSAARKLQVLTASQGRHAPLVKQLIKELETAQETLKNAVRKEEYDRQLATVSERPTPPPIPKASEVPQAAAVRREPPDRPMAVVAARMKAPALSGSVTTKHDAAARVSRPAARQPSQTAVLFGCVAGSLIVILAIALLVLPNQMRPPKKDTVRRPDASSGAEESTVPAPSKPSAAARKPPRRREPMRPSPAQRPRGPQTLADLLARANEMPSETTKKEPPSSPDSPEPSPPTPSSPAPSPPSPAPSPAKAPIPDPKPLAETTERIRDLLQQELLHADSAEKRTALVQQLLKMGETATSDPIHRYACFLLAREQAGRVGDPQLIEQVVDRLERHYKVDALFLKAETMATAWRSDYSIPHRVALFKRAQELLVAAMANENHAAAGQAIRVVMAGARAAKDYRMLRELEALRDQIRAMEEET